MTSVIGDDEQGCESVAGDMKAYVSKMVKYTKRSPVLYIL
jgi:hypothetical protein